MLVWFSSTSRDNIEVDVYGANLYQHYINNGLDNQRLPASRHPPSSDLLLAQSVDTVESLLVLTGVSGANIRAEQDEKEALPSHRQSHGEFPQGDETLFDPSRVFSHVLDAVSYVVEKEHLR